MQVSNGAPSVASLMEELTTAQERISELEAVLQSSSPGQQSDKEARKVMPVTTLAPLSGICQILEWKVLHSVRLLICLRPRICV